MVVIGIVCAAGFPLVRWHELLAIAAVALMMILCAIVLSLGNTGFKASIAVSRRRVTVGDDVHVTVDIDNPGRTPTTTARGDLPLGEAHERFGIPMLAPGQSKQTDIEFTTVSRAVLTVGPLNIRKGDPFGLVRHEKALAERITVYIHPNIVWLGLEVNERIFMSNTDFQGSWLSSKKPVVPSATMAKSKTLLIKPKQRHQYDVILFLW